MQHTSFDVTPGVTVTQSELSGGFSPWRLAQVSARPALFTSIFNAGLVSPAGRDCNNTRSRGVRPVVGRDAAQIKNAGVPETIHGRASGATTAKTTQVQRARKVHHKAHCA